MTGLLSDIKDKFKQANIATRFIYINTGLFIVVKLIELILYLFGYNYSLIQLYTSLPAHFNLFVQRPWSLISYMFMHAGLLHLFFNMLLLYWFGQFFLRHYSAKHLRGLYFLGGIAGGISFFIAYAVFPILQPMASSAHLIGASAAVLAVVIAIATEIPNESVRLLFVGGVKLKYLALFVVLTDLLMIISDNPGGHIAHLGGALAGFFFAKGLRQGIDLTRWINAILDIPVFIQERIKKAKDNKKMRVAYKNSKRAQDYEYNARKQANAAEIDRILDKIKESGYNNLSEQEKQKLFDAGK